MPNPKTPAPDPALDALDRQILAELQADGRITNVELARRVNLSAPPCL
ncbi:MAG: AsnC family transcriptional regulator, partial [Roseomonas sp.]|nr:AsnC family transcriptional regulator [Roseomonas sp.]MCE2923504.1 AsnC family transcriptional regulator [Roseomonas sp.]